MVYDFEGLNRRIKAIEDGYNRVASEFGVSRQRINRILDGTTSPKLSTMTKLNEVIKKLEQEQENLVRSNPEIFLPSSVIISPSCS